jgi:hypothetical protein
VTQRLVAVAVLALASGLMSVASTGCSGCAGDAPLQVRKILVDVEPQAVGIDREQVRSIIEETIGRSRGIRIVDPSRGDAAVLRVRIEGYGARAGEAGAAAAAAPPTGSGPDKTTLALAIEVTSVPGEPAGTEYRGHALATSTGVVDTRSLVGQAVRDALAQVLMTRNAGELKSAQLITWLADDASEEQKKRAIRILGSRREKAAVAAIGKILVGDDKELQPLALAALENIGDPGAVDAVIAYSDRQPAVVKKECIEAVRTMGSQRAKAWLFTLSTGAPDLDVQEQAQAALASLEAQRVEVPTVAEHVDDKQKTTATP